MRCLDCNSLMTKEEIKYGSQYCDSCFADNVAKREVVEEVVTTTPKDNNPIEPNHYTDMAISPLEFIEANMDVLTWCTMNVIKYVGRHQRKNGLEDLKKARWYLDHEIERLEND